MPQVYGSDMEEELPPATASHGGAEVTGMRWKKRGQQQEIEFVDAKNTEARDDTQPSRMHRLCQPVPCFPVRGIQGATSESSIASLPQPPAPEEPKTPLQRMSTIKNKIRKSTADFFGLGEEEEQALALNRKWTQRRQRHYSRRYGQLRPEATVPPEPGDIVDAAPESVTSIGSTPGYAFKRRKSRKESVASMAWKGLRHRVLTTSTFQRPESSMSTVGRSFTPATILEAQEADDSAFHEDHIDGASKFTFGKSLDDEVFFDVVSAKTPASIASAPMQFTNERYGKDLVPSTEVPATGLDLTGPPLTPEELDGPPQPRRHELQRLPSVRGQRMAQHPPKPQQADRREFGKGLVGRWLNRTIRRKRITSSVNRQLQDICDHRPYFTYWISFVHVLIAIMTVSVYGFAPVGFTETEYTETIHVSQGGFLVPKYASKKVLDNFWIGPDQETLITLGAKYAPCMRYDKLLMDTLQQEVYEENESGCCIRSDANGCLQTSRQDCSTSFSTFYKYTPKNVSRAVCGQDPRSCKKPPSRPPQEWDKHKITNWPLCKEKYPIENFASDEFPHLHCEVTGRPCCLGSQARCIITSHDDCVFKGGHYHEEATLCSQVDCLKAICGLIPFLDSGKPDQIYRLWISLFLHAGLLHLILTLAFHFTILRDVEKMAGWLRVSIIYIFSGIGGNLVSSILIPYQTEVGPAGSLFGVIACLFVELFQSWQMILFPKTALFKLCGLVFALILIGTLPYVDNFAHISGFVFGFFLAVMFLPYLYFGKWDRRRKMVQIFIAFGFLIFFYTIGFIIFYVDQDASCPGCEYLNCIPLSFDFCKNSHLGQQLQPR